MSDHLDDDEQLESLKRWWQENGTSTVTAVVLAVAGTLSWQQYQSWDLTQAEVASDAWEQASAALGSEDPAEFERGKQAAEALLADHGGKTYAQLAAMKLAALAVSEGDLAAAETFLRDALVAGDASTPMGQLIQLRLARVMAAQGDEAGALGILDAGSDAHAAAYAIARGDIHLTAGREQEALDAYLEARQASRQLGSAPGILDAKITSLESRLAASEVSS